MKRFNIIIAILAFIIASCGKDGNSSMSIFESLKLPAEYVGMNVTVVERSSNVTMHTYEVMQGSPYSNPIIPELFLRAPNSTWFKSI